jgi:hypothetical protein
MLMRTRNKDKTKDLTSRNISFSLTLDPVIIGLLHETDAAIVKEFTKGHTENVTSIGRASCVKGPNYE